MKAPKMAWNASQGPRVAGGAHVASRPRFLAIGAARTTGAPAAGTCRCAPVPCSPSIRGLAPVCRSPTLSTRPASAGVCGWRVWCAPATRPTAPCSLGELAVGGRPRHSHGPTLLHVRFVHPHGGGQRSPRHNRVARLGVRGDVVHGLAVATAGRAYDHVQAAPVAVQHAVLARSVAVLARAA